jgi:hypothetical protein
MPGTCGKSLSACQNRRVIHIPAVVASLLLLAAGCGRAPEPVPEQPPAPAAAPQPREDWLGPLQRIEVPAGPGARYPHLAAAPGGRPLVMSWLEPGANGDEFYLRHASWLPDRRWSAATKVVAGDDWFINWADFPSVVPVDERRWVAHWLQQKPGGIYSYDAMVRLSEDGGATWGTPRALHDDGTATEHGFVSIANAAGRAYAVWLDGRKTSAEAGHEGGHHGTAGGAMTLRGTIVAPGPQDSGVEIDDRVCDCCQTDAAGSGDGLVVVYRDRDDRELRDIRAVRLGADGWSAPAIVHADGWRIDACPVNGPAVAALDDDVVVAWFTAPDVPRVRLAYSSDGGRTFAAPIEVASGKVAGRVDVVLLPDRRAVVSWMQESTAGAALRAQPFTAAGAAGAAIDFATTDVASSSGFPQMLGTGDGLLFAWTGTDPGPALRVVYAALH